jgi:RNA polymerase sigma factor (sigma-70 family)
MIALPYSPPPADLAVLQQVVRQTARVRRLTTDDADEFQQWVHLRMVERQYEPLQQFAGRSTLRTYLTVVVTRLMLDWQDQRFGKWRASAAARRLGRHAELLERLIYRDGYSHNEAIALVQRCGDCAPRLDLERLIGSLSARTPRRRASDSVLDTIGIPFEDPVIAQEESEAEMRGLEALERVLQELPAEERMLVTARFKHSRSVRSLAEETGVDAKGLYRRFDRILEGLRGALSAHGVTAARTLRA